ncbi:MAG: LolA family protein [Streptosporangiaceae bacterium]
MLSVLKLSRRARWAVPVGALVVTGAVMAGSLISVAQAAPVLPPRTPAQLLAAVAQGQAPALTGTVLETVSLGLPALPETGNPTSIASLLTGSHTIQVWYASPRRYRLAVPQSLSETDVVRNGGTVWLWQSTQNTVTKLTVHAAVPATGAPSPQSSALTPQQAAQQALKMVGPTTTVSIDSNVTVAGQAAYELVLAPKDSRSLIGQVRIAIDASNSVPLRLEVFARGAASPAISVGYTAISFGAPSAADTSFTPPPGAQVTTVSPGQGGQQGTQDGEATTIGSGWLTVLAMPSAALLSGQPLHPVQADQGSSEDAAALQALLGSATYVHGSWGIGRLLRTSLVSMLITIGGTVFVGAVQPSVLYAAAGQAGHQLGALPAAVP